MPNVITDLCLRDGSCMDTCPVDCIVPGKPEGLWPHYYIDPISCIDCGRLCDRMSPRCNLSHCRKCPRFIMLLPVHVYLGLLEIPGFDETYNGTDNNGIPIFLKHTLFAHEEYNYRFKAMQARKTLTFFSEGPGYKALKE